MSDLKAEQIEALAAMDVAARRLEKARKELSEALTEHNRAEQRARRLCPYIFTPNSAWKSEDDQ